MFNNSSLAAWAALGLSVSMCIGMNVSFAFLGMRVKALEQRIEQLEKAVVKPEEEHGQR